jgi:hypothetical protein
MTSSVPFAARSVSYQRSDDHQRQIVDHALRVQRTSNTVAALEYMKAYDIHPDVIARVLLDPAKRRSCQ